MGAINEDSNQQGVKNDNSSASSNDSKSESGAVYVYKRTGTKWAQTAYIKGCEGKSGDYFGYSISLDNNTLVSGGVTPHAASGSYQANITNGTCATRSGSSYLGRVFVFYDATEPAPATYSVGSTSDTTAPVVVNISTSSGSGTSE